MSLAEGVRAGVWVFCFLPPLCGIAFLADTRLTRTRRRLGKVLMDTLCS